MPFISTKTTKTLTKEMETRLKEAYGKAIELLPGKTEKWLMLSFDGGAHMAFHGDSESDMAFITVSLVGKAPCSADCRGRQSLHQMRQTPPRKRNVLCFAEIAAIPWIPMPPYASAAAVPRAQE